MRMSLNDNAERLFARSCHRLSDRHRLSNRPGRSADGQRLHRSRRCRCTAKPQRLFPRNVPLTISYAEALIAAGQAAEAHALLLDLLNNVEATPEQLRLIARAANAEGDVGERVLLHVVLLRLDRQPASSRSAKFGWLSRRPASTRSTGHVSRPGSKQLIDYLPARGTRTRRPVGRPRAPGTSASSSLAPPSLVDAVIALAVRTQLVLK